MHNFVFLSQQEETNNLDAKVETFPHIRGVRAHISVKVGAGPVCQGLRRIPIALEAKVEKRLQELLELGIIEKVDGYSPYQSNIVPVPSPVLKKDGSLWLCVDARAVNRVILKESHPYPNWEYISSKFHGAAFFSKLDIKDAFYQVLLDEILVTHVGVFRCTRLMFGLSSAPEIFQRIIQTILAGLKGVIVYIDDIIVVSTSSTEHDQRLKEVLQRLSKSDILLNVAKCEFKRTKLSFLGHEVSREGVSPDQQKIKSLVDCNPPINASELKSFLGLVSYVGSRYIPDLAVLTEPLRQLTVKGRLTRRPSRRSNRRRQLSWQTGTFQQPIEPCYTQTQVRKGSELFYVRSTDRGRPEPSPVPARA